MENKNKYDDFVNKDLLLEGHQFYKAGEYGKAMINYVNVLRSLREYEGDEIGAFWLNQELSSRIEKCINMLGEDEENFTG